MVKVMAETEEKANLVSNISEKAAQLHTHFHSIKNSFNRHTMKLNVLKLAIKHLKWES